MVSCDPHVHSIVKIEEKASNCSESGHRSYYSCQSCGDLFSDGKGKNRISVSDVVLEKDSDNHFRLSYIKKTDSTCSSQGMEAHWHCDGCGKDFNDENGTDPNVVSLPVDNSVHSLRHYSAVGSTCKEHGTVEYWKCRDCEKIFADENASVPLVSIEAPFDETRHIQTEHVPSVTHCTYGSSTEYWHCIDCGRYYLEHEMTTEVEESSIHFADCVIQEGSVSVSGAERSFYYCSQHSRNIVDGNEKLKLYPEFINNGILAYKNTDTNEISVDFIDSRYFILKPETSSSSGYSVLGFRTTADKTYFYNLSGDLSKIVEIDKPILTGSEDENGKLTVSGSCDFPMLSTFTIDDYSIDNIQIRIVAANGEKWIGYSFINHLIGVYVDSSFKTLTFTEDHITYEVDGTDSLYFPYSDENSFWQGTITIKSDGNSSHLSGSNHRWIFWEGSDKAPYIKWKGGSMVIGTNLNSFTIYSFKH